MDSKPAATINLNGFADLTTEGKREVIAWLWREADFIDAHIDDIDSYYQGRWWAADSHYAEVVEIDASEARAAKEG